MRAGRSIPRPPTQEEVTEISERAALLGSLVDHPAWDELKRSVAEQRDIYERNMLKKIRRRDLIDQHEIDYLAGYWDGIEKILDRPETAMKKLETTLKRAQQEEDDESA